MRLNLLCQCGWGRLAVPLATIPDECPLCGQDLMELKIALGDAECTDGIEVAAKVYAEVLGGDWS